MSFDQEEKEKQVAFFGQQKCGGLFGNKQYTFVLGEPYRLENLYNGLLPEVLDYFATNSIDWWRGQNGLPTNLTIATQIACVNHLYWLYNQPEAATALLQKLDSRFYATPFANGRYFEPEYNGSSSENPQGFLGETSRKRGPSGTSLQGAMLAMRGEEKILVAIEWRYCEKYYQKAIGVDDEDPIYLSRRERFKALLNHADCPIKWQRTGEKQMNDYHEVYRKFSVEPFYQLMTQTLLAWQLAARGIEGVTDYLYVQVLPAQNNLLRHGETSREITAGCTDICQGWQQMLKVPEKYQAYDPAVLLAEVTEQYAPELADYLQKRYWHQ